MDDAANPANVMLRTEVIVGAAEFETYNVGNAAENPLTVFCKYFRAALDFCDVVEEPIKMWFEKAGRPLMLELAGRGNADAMLFDAIFVFASRVVEGGEEGERRVDHAVAENKRDQGKGFATGGTQMQDMPLQRFARTATEVEVGETPARSDHQSGHIHLNSAVQVSSDKHSADDDHEEQDDADFVEGTPPP